MGFENEASSSSKSLLQSEASSHLNSPKLSSQPKTFANIFIAIVGAGVLGLPYAFKRTGWAAGTLIILFVGALTYHCMMLISRTRLRLLLQPYRMDPSQISSFGDIGLAVAGPAGRLAVDALIVLSHSGYCVGYLIFISNVLSLLLPYPKSLYILAILPFQIALNSVRSLTLLAPLSIFADVIDFAAMAVVLREDFVAGRLDRTDLVWFSGPAEILYGFGVAVFSFEVMGMVLPLESEAADKERFGRTLGLSMGVISLVYAAFGAFGYAAFGDATRDVITSNLGRGKVAVVVQVGLCINLFFTFPVMMNPVYEVGERLFCGKRYCVWLRWAAVGAVSAVALLAPSFTDFLSLVGGTVCSLLGFVLPPSFHLRVFGPEMGPLAVAADVVIIFFGLAVAVSATCSSLLAIFGP